MSKIDPTARIEDGAVIGDGASIGPYCIVGPNVTIGADCKLHAHVNVAGHTTLGVGCEVYPFASLGTPPQSLGHNGELTRLEIGDRCIMRESVSINAGTVGGGGVTRVGARGFFMAYSHIAHDCQIGNDVILANGAQLGGHCEVGDYVFFLEGLNVVGMRRRKFTHKRLQLVREFYQQLFHGGGVFSDRLAAVRPMIDSDPAIAEILKFIDEGDKRPLCMAHNNPNKSTERAHLESR